jgi:hypothetical protein
MYVLSPPRNDAEDAGESGAQRKGEQSGGAEKGFRPVRFLILKIDAFL